MKNSLACLFALCLALAAAPARATVWYVDAAAQGGTADGSSWAGAFPALQPALAVAQYGDTVWVAQGTYRPTDGTNRHISFNLKNGVCLLGGFTGTESAPSQRDWAAHPAVLSGDIGVPGDTSDNSFTVVFGGFLDSMTVLDGFVVTLGNANSLLASDQPSGRTKSGGGMYLSSSMAGLEARPQVRNCVFTMNYAHSFGGAVFLRSSATGRLGAVFSGCVFSKNWASVGAGAYLSGSGHDGPTLFQQCVLDSNEAQLSGGGLHFAAGFGKKGLAVEGCSFTANTALLGGCGIDVEANVTKTWLVVRGCTFRYNHTGTVGEGTSIRYFAFADSCHLLLEGSTIEKEHSDGMGQVSLYGTHNVIERVIFNENYSKSSPINFALYDQEYNILIANTLIINTKSDEATILFSDTEQNNVIFTNVVMYRNETKNELLAFFPINGSSETQYEIVNCIFTENITGGNKLILDDGLASISHTLTDLPSCGDISPTITCGPGMLYATPPMFLDTAAGDFRLHPCSPARDAGNSAAAATATDLAGQPRTQGTAVDMGAYESPGFRIAAADVVQPPCGNGQPGTVQFLLENGCPPFFLDWGTGSATAGSTPASIALPAGSHAVTVTDGRMAADTASVLLVPVPALSGALAVVPVGCGTASGGTATAAPAGGTPPFAFLWSSGDTAAAASALPVGPVAVTVTDANGCAWAAGAEVPAAGQLPLGISVSPVSCHGAQDGTAGVLPGGGLPPFAWAWGTGDTTALLDSLGGGSYSATVTDALGCTGELSFLLNAPLPVAVAVSLDGPACAGGSAAAVAAATGGNGGFGFLWSTGAAAPAASLPPGTHSVTATDSKGCSGTAAVTVTPPPPLSAAVAVQGGMPCPGQPTGALAALPAGGTPPYAYAWDGQTATDSLLTGLPPGGYLLTVTDSNGCTASAPATVTAWPDIVVADTVTHASGPGAADGSIAVTAVSGGSGAGYTFLWDNGAATPGIGQLPPGTYLLTVTDGAGCQAGFSFTVSVASAATGRPGGPFRAAVVPNPSGSHGAALAFDGPLPPGLTVSVVDVLGRELASGSGTDLPPGLPPGTYFVVLRTGQQQLALVWVVW